MSSLGELFFSLGLDSQKFDDAIKKAKDEVAKLTGEATITASIDADASRIKEQVQSEISKLEGKKGKIHFEVDKSNAEKIKELVASIAEAETELKKLESAKVQDVAAISNRKGALENFKRQLAELWQIEAAANEAKKSINEVAQSTQTIQHVVREEDIERVDRLTSALEKQNEQLELRNRLDQGKLDAAEKNKAEREEAARIKAEQKAAEKAQKEAEKEAKARIKAEEKATKEAEREEAARLRRLDKESKAIQKQQIAEQKILEGRKKMQEEEYNLTRWARKQEVANSSIYESAEYKREQNLLKLHFEEQERIAKFSAQWMSEERDRKKKESKDAEVRIRQEEKELELIAKRRKISEGWLNETRNQKDKQRETEVSSSRSELHNQLAQLQRLEQAIRKLQYMKVDLDTSDVDKDSEDYKKAAAALDAYIDKLQEMQGSGKRLSKNKVDDVLGADISELMKKANRVRNGGKWVKEELDEAKDSVSAFGEALGQAFNYYMIERFVRNLYTIGGEFQKQQIALQAMIGDVNKANSIFERTKDMAVMSPFTFSELASYTKQMAAYGIEYEELYDTTKRLADISAGVGVDMGRLILAFGQVRSAAVLRGQELRQFTEAGIPMVNELAKAFSRLENREVKAAEVFDKISRREVSFGMVKDVLFGMTDPGGRFFEMQEELAQSLAGQWSNLKDAWEIMIAEIADSANGPLNVLASVMRNIISGWRLWLPLISGAAVGITALNAGLRVTSMLLSAGMMSAATVANIANPLIGALTTVLGIAAGIGAYKSTMESAEDAQKRLNAEMETSLTKLSENERTANRYLDILSKTASKESDKDELLRRQKATLEVLRSMYGDIVQDVKLEELTTERILEWRQKIGNLTSKESGDLLQKNVEENLRALNNAQAELERLSKGTITENIDTGDGKILTVTRKVTQNEIDEATSNVLKFESLYNRAIERQQEYFNRQEEIAQEDLSGWRQKAEELIKGTTLQAPKEDQGMQEYFKYLKEEYDAGKAEFELYAENNPITAANKASAKALRDAANRVNIGLGGVSFLESKKDDGQAGKDAKEAERRGKEMAKAFAAGVKEEVERISSQWDLYKDLFEATGDKQLSMNIAFGGVMPNFDSYISHLKGLMQEEIQKRGLGISVADLLSEGKEGIAKRVNDKSQTAWNEDVAKNLNAIIDSYNNANKKLREESVRNFLDIIKNSKDFAQQIADIDRELQKDLSDLAKMTGGTDSELYNRRAEELIKKAEEEKTKVNFEEFKKSSDWVKVFDDLNRVSDATLDSMITKIEEFAKQAHLSEEVTKQLVDAMGKLRDESINRNPFQGFNDAWGRLKYLKSGFVTKSGMVRYGSGTDEDPFTFKSKKEVDDGVAEANDDLEKSALAVADKFQAAANAADLLGGLFENLGLELGGLGDILGGTASGAQTGAGIASALGVAGPWGAIAGAAVGMLSSVFAMHDKALQKEIEASQSREKLIKSVASNLENTLNNKLGGIFTISLDAASKKQMETLMTLAKDNEGRRKKKELVYSDATRDMAQEALNDDSYYKAQKALLMSQIDELKNQKKAEEDKKNEDQVKIADYELAIAEMEGELEMFAQDMMNAIYGIDFKDWAGQFTDAIVGAWASGEDAAEAYKNTVSDVMRNVAASVIQQGIIGKWLEENMSHVLELFSKNDGKITSDVYSAMADLAAGVGGKIEETESFLEAWEKLLNEKGYSMKDLESASGGSLSKGIQSVTEDTANLLGSYLNAIRQSVHVKQQFIEKLVSEDIPKINYLAEAQLRELSQIQANTARNVVLVGEIRDLVNRVVDKGSNKLKV